MSIFQTIGLTTAVLLLILYDVHVFSNVERKKILLEGLYTQHDSVLQSLASDSESNVKLHPRQFRSPLIKNWSHIEEIQAVYDQLNAVRAGFSIEDNPLEVTSSLDDTVVQDSLLKLHELHHNLSLYLVKAVTTDVSRAIAINLVGGILLSLVFFLFLNQQHKRLLSTTKTTNIELEAQQEELIASKKTLLSLMEDVQQEKESALALSRELTDINQQLSDKNQEMEQFIYTVSHDLRSPLVTIGGFTTRLIDKAGPVLDDASLHKLERIKFNVDHMGRLLADLLQLSRVIKMEFTRTNVDVDEVIQQQLGTLEAPINQSNATIEVEDNIKPIYCNASMLAQCVNNLVSNAINYRSLERPLKINIYSSQTDETINLHFADNGIGIEKLYFAQIFRIFERLETGEGTGVGLTIVKSIMEKHRGKVLLESTPGEGSIFTLVFLQHESNQ